MDNFSINTDSIEHIAKVAYSKLKNIKDVKSLVKYKKEFLGDNSQLTKFSRQMRYVPDAKKPELGKLLSQTKKSIEQNYSQKYIELEKKEEKLNQQHINKYSKSSDK